METEVAEVAAVEVAVWEEQDRRHKYARFGKFLLSGVRVLFSYILKRGKHCRENVTYKFDSAHGRSAHSDQRPEGRDRSDHNRRDGGMNGEHGGRYKDLNGGGGGGYYDHDRGRHTDREVRCFHSPARKEIDGGVGRRVVGGGEGKGEWGTEDVIETMEVALILLQAMLLRGT